MVSNEYERDFEKQGALKRPGRIDFRLFQNIDNAGDGYPGLQKCLRNYLHEGGMEKDLDLVGHGIKGTSVNIDNAELQQLSNIDASVITTSIWSQIANITSATISSAQWVYLGDLDQAIKIGSSPSYLKMTLTQTTGTSPLTVSSSTKVTNLNVDQCDGQHLGTGNSPTFAGLTMTGAIAMGDNKITNMLDPTADQEAATKIYVDNHVKNYLPIGTILMYNGTGWVDNTSILGWYKCDGNNGTPNLLDKFIRSESSSGNAGGSDDAIVVEHNHSASQSEHNHDLKRGISDGIATRVDFSSNYLTHAYEYDMTNNVAPAITVNSNGISGVGANKPKYYSLIFIMRVS